MTVTVNGQPRDLPAGSTVADLLSEMKLDARRAAVERNKQLVRRAEHDSTALAEGDVIEVVSLVGGG
jgi:sulfur carrier protein